MILIGNILERSGISWREFDRRGGWSTFSRRIESDGIILIVFHRIIIRIVTIYRTGTFLLLLLTIITALILERVDLLHLGTGMNTGCILYRGDPERLGQSFVMLNESGDIGPTVGLYRTTCECDVTERTDVGTTFRASCVGRRSERLLDTRGTKRMGTSR